MTKPKLSGPAVFMYSTMVLTALIAALCFVLYYSGLFASGVVLWTGIVAFMILYHFGLRIFMGKLTVFFPISPQWLLFRPLAFERKLYRLLRVKQWKGHVLTFEPENFDLQTRTLEQVAHTMCKSELDHWINELISLTSLLFSLLWGQFPIFLVTALAAMIFDAQFIVVQRYNRPKVLRLAERRRHP